MNGASFGRKLPKPNEVPDFDWDEDAVNKLRHYHGAGLSASQIGGILGTTRNSVIGKIHQLRLNGRVHAPKPRAARPKVAAKPAVRRMQQAKPIPRPRIIVPEPPMLDVLPLPNAWEPISDAEPVALVDLDRGMCKWPVSEGRPFLFCGCKAEEGASYCPSHQRRSLGTGTPSERKALSIAVNEVKKERVSA